MGTEPLFGFALSWALLSEAVSASTLFGAALIVGGTFLGLAFERERIGLAPACGVTAEWLRIADRPAAGMVPERTFICFTDD